MQGRNRKRKKVAIANNLNQSNKKSQKRAGPTYNEQISKSAKPRKNDSYNKSVIDMTLPLDLNFRSYVSTNSHKSHIDAFENIDAISPKDMQLIFFR